MKIYTGIAIIIILLGIAWVVTDFYNYRINNPLGEENSKQNSLLSNFRKAELKENSNAK